MIACISSFCCISIVQVFFHPIIRQSTCLCPVNFCTLSQDGPVRTTKALLRSWQHSESGYSPFDKWNALKQQNCISKCGLAYRLYRNKKSRNQVLAQLAKYDIPLDIDAVKEQLTRHHIPINSRYPTKLVLSLLEHLSGVTRPSPHQNGTARQVKGPCSEDTCKIAREHVEKLMFQATDEFTTPSLEKLWQQRRQVLGRVYGMCVCASRVVCACVRAWYMCVNANDHVCIHSGLVVSCQ